MSTSKVCTDFFKVLKWKLTDCLPANEHYFKLFAVIILTFGLISNILLLLTLTRKKLIKNPNNLFLITIAICGSIAIWIYFGLFILDQYTDHYTYIWTYIWWSTLPTCYLVCAIHTWSTVCLAGWRVMTLDFPLQNSVRMTGKRVIINIVIITLVVITFHIPHFTNYFINEVKCESSDPIFDSAENRIQKQEFTQPPPPPSSDEDPGRAPRRVPRLKFGSSNTSFSVHYIASRVKNLETIGFYIQSVGMQIIPNFLLLIFTLILLQKLSLARKRKQQLLMARNGVHSGNSGEISSLSGHQNVTQTKSDAVNHKETKIVLETSHALILIFIVSLACDLPISIKILVDLIRFPDMDKVIFTNIGYICNIFKLLNCSMVLALCCITSSLFRNTCCAIIGSVARVIFLSKYTGWFGGKKDTDGQESHEFQTISTSMKTRRTSDSQMDKDFVDADLN